MDRPGIFRSVYLEGFVLVSSVYHRTLRTSRSRCGIDRR